MTGSAVATVGSETHPGAVRQGGSYRVHANVNPARTAAVKANLDNISPGETGVSLSALGGPWPIGGIPYTYRSDEKTAGNPVAQGAKTYTVTGAEPTTGLSSSTSYSVAVDNTAPTTTDDVPSTWRNTNVTVTFASNDFGGAGLRRIFYSTNGTEPTTQGTSVTLSAEGEYTVKYKAEDWAGNIESVVTATNTVRIDKTPPTITSSFNTAWTKNPVAVTLVPVDTGGSGIASTYYTSDGSTPTTSSSQGTSFTLSAQGQYTIKYFTVDVAGNSSGVQTAPSPVRIDTTAPTTSHSAPTVEPAAPGR